MDIPPDTTLHDHSTLAGKIKIISSKLSWKWILSSLFLVGLMTWAIVADTREVGDGIQNRNILTSTSNDLYTKFDNTTFTLKASGVENRLVLLPPLNSLNLVDPLLVRKLHLKNVLIDAPKLTLDLHSFPNLRYLIMDKVTVSGDFTRVPLPHLVEFYLSLHRNLHIDSYKDPVYLKSLLFFDLGQTGSWDFDNLLTLNVKVTFAVGGTTLLEIDPSIGLINLNVHSCAEILKSSAQIRIPPKKLSLSWCSVTWSNLSLPSLQYLNLNNAVPVKEELVGILENSKNLIEFHALLPFLCENISYVTPEYPELQLELNIAKFPSTIRTVSVSKMMVTSNFDPNEELNLSGSTSNFVSPIANLSLETCNLTGILDDFEKTFQNLKRVAIFNMTFPSDAYKMLDKILETEAEWILMVQFQRKPKTEKEEQLEKFLIDIGVPDMTNHFLIEKKGRKNIGMTFDPRKENKKVYTGRSLTDFEANYFRYTLLAFNDIDTYDDYVIWDAHPDLKYSDKV